MTAYLLAALALALAFAAGLWAGVKLGVRWHHQAVVRRRHVLGLMESDRVRRRLGEWPGPKC